MIRRLGLVVLLLPAIAAGSTKVNTCDLARYPAVLAGPNGEWIVVYTAIGCGNLFGIARFDSHGVRTFGPAQFEYDIAYPPDDAVQVAWTGSAIGWGGGSAHDALLSGPPVRTGVG